MSNPIAVILASTLLLLSATSSLAQDTADAPAEATTAAAPPTGREIEQITVTGERTLLSMKNALERAEEDMYRAFNSLNSNDDFDIFCVTETKTTSHIVQRGCEPVFLTNLRKETSQNALSQIRNAYTTDGIDVTLLNYGLSFLESEKELKAQASDKYEALSLEILRIANENPDYMDALRRIGELREEYEAARKARFGSE